MKRIALLMLLFVFVLGLSSSAYAKKIYVIKQVNSNGYKEKIKYRKDGLIKSRSYGKGSTSKFYYKKGRIVRIVAGKSQKFYYKYKNGRLSKITEHYRSKGYNINRYEKYRYNKKGQNVKIIYTDSKSSDKEVVKYSYNKKNLIKTRRYSGGTTKYKYDKHKNVKWLKDSTDSKHPSVIRSKYKHGRLIRSVATNMGDANKLTITYKYKKIHVKKKYYKRIKKQNWDIINQNYL